MTMDFARATATLRTIASIRDVGMALVWQSATWVKHPTGRWHMLRPDHSKTTCGRVMPSDSRSGSFRDVLAADRVCRLCMR